MRLYAYTLDGGTRQTDIEFLLSGDTRDPRGIWSDGSTLWVSSLTFSQSKPLVAYTLDFSSNNGGTTHTVGNLHGLPDWGKSFYTPGTLQLMGAGIWSDGDTAIWMASTGPAGKIYSFNTLPSQAGGVSLSSLTVNDGTNNVGLLPGFNLKDVVYWTSVANDVNVVTVSATASGANATLEYVNEDADSASGHQVDVAEGTTPIGILVTAPDGAALIHRVYVERDSSRFGGWTPTKDIHGLVADGIAYPTGIWSDGTTMWVVDERDFKLYAYTLATGARNEDREFDLDPANDYPHGLWSDGTTIWVGSRSTVNLKLFAYTLNDDTTTTPTTDEKGQREPDKDILLDASNDAASGIWSNGTDTVWVAEQIEDKLYAYTLDIGSTGEAGPNHGMRKTGSDITLQGPAEHWGIWSDGTTMWEGNNPARSIRAYTLATGVREESKDIPFAPYQAHTWGIWSDGSTMWTVHGKGQRLPYVYSRIFSHTLPSSGGATTLSNLTVTPSPAVSSFTATLRPTFSSTTNSYGVAVPNAAALVTISPTLSDNAATAAYQDEDGVTLADADLVAPGRQVSVPVGTFVIKIKITKTGEPSITYTVHVERDSAERFGWTPTKDLNTFYQDNPEAAGQAIRGVWSDGTTLYVAPHNRAKVFAFDPTDGTRIATKDIVTTSDFPINSQGRHAPIIFAGIWSDGTTMWVVDYNRVHDADGNDLEDMGTPPRRYGKLFAYGLMDGERDKTKEFVLDPIHDESVRGVWSNGTTLWVSDWKLNKLIAYHLKDNPGTSDVEVLGTRDVDKDIVLHSENDSAQGIWSDGTTIWVAQWNGPKFFAYTLATGVRDTDKEFDRVPGNIYPRDMWSDGTTLYVPDALRLKLFSYTMTDGTTTTDTPGVTVIPTALTVREEDATGASYAVVLGSLPTSSVLITVAGHSGTDVTPTPTTLTFTTSNWEIPQTITVTAAADANLVNETVRLTHTATSSDSLFDGITIPSVIVNVDDQDAPDHHIRTIRVPHDLPLGATALPEEKFEVWLGPPFEETIVGVTQGHRWSPSGIWGLPEAGIIWVVDPIHFGIHALKLSALKEGRVERHIAAGASEFDRRFNYRCHFSESRASGYGNPSLTVMWGSPPQLWIANESSGTLDAYDRNSSITNECYTENVTSWATDGRSYTTEDEDFKSRFGFVRKFDLPLGPLTVWGIWARGTQVWLSGPPGGVYTIDLGTGQMAIAPGYDGHGTSYGLWSDETTMWVATDSGWLRAYNLTSGRRRAEFDIRIQTDSMPPGDIWSDGETIWVTNRAGRIDAYRLPGTSGGSRTLKATEADPLTASFALAPEAHDGENGFKLRIAFSDDVEITPEDMRDHALLVSGGTVTDAARVKGRSDLWELTVEPAGPGPVSILAPLGRACTDQGALCTADGRSLTAGPALVVPGPPADGPPDAPDQPEGTAVFVGGVDLEWNDVPGAESYDVQQYRGGQWTGLPADGVEIAFYGAGAIISGLDPEASLWFRVRAANAHGVSDWSEMLYMNSISQFKSGRQARPDNEPASGAPVVHGTAQVGESLWADATGIEDGNGLDRVQFQFQWTSNDGSADTDIAGETNSGYTLVADDVGRTIRARVAFTDRGGYSETRTSAATEAVAAAPQPDSPATGQPSITGTAQVGEELTADTTGITDADGLVNATYSYQWVANDGTTDTDISGETDATYTLLADDEGKTIKVRVTFTDDAGNETTLTSTATDVVGFAVQQQGASNTPATGAPTITGTAQVGEELTADTTGIADADGLVNATYSYQWVANDGTTDTDISGETDATYTLLADDEGQTIKVRVTVTDDAGNEDNPDQCGHGSSGGPRAAGQAHGTVRRRLPRRRDPHLGRPAGRRHHRLRHPAARPGDPSHRDLRHDRRRHRLGGHHLHRRYGGAEQGIRVPHQGHQRARGGEREVRLGSGLHPGGPRPRPAHGTVRRRLPRHRDPHLGRPAGRRHHRLRHPAARPGDPSHRDLRHDHRRHRLGADHLHRRYGRAG